MVCKESAQIYMMKPIGVWLSWSRSINKISMLVGLAKLLQNINEVLTIKSIGKRHLWKLVKKWKKKRNKGSFYCINKVSWKKCWLYHHQTHAVNLAIHSFSPDFLLRMEVTDKLKFYENHNHQTHDDPFFMRRILPFTLSLTWPLNYK